MVAVATPTTTTVPDSGIPLSDFASAADALKKLRDEGKYQVYLSRDGYFRLIGDIDNFRARLATLTGTEASDQLKAKACLLELQTAMQVALTASSEDEAVSYLQEALSSAPNKSTETPSAELLGILKQKISLVSELLLNAGMRARRDRLGTTTGPIIEDLDVDVVSARRSLTGGSTVNAPFLRVSLRYTLGGELRHPFPFSPPPWMVTSTPFKTRVFELECDEADIDLLIGRLIEAKDLLRRAVEAKVAAVRSDP